MIPKQLFVEATEIALLCRFLLKEGILFIDIEPEDCVNEILEESDDSMNAIEEDIDKERSVHNKLEKVAIADKVKVFDRNEADKKIEGLVYMLIYLVRVRSRH